MERMDNDSLVNRVADAIENCDDAEYPVSRKTFEQEARAVLAALGLDAADRSELVRETLARTLYDAYIWDLEDFYGPPVGWEASRPHIQARFREDAGNVLALLGIACGDADRADRYEAALRLILSPHGLDVSDRIREIAESALSPNEGGEDV